MKKHITLLSGLLLFTTAFGQVSAIKTPVSAAKKLDGLRTGKMVASNVQSVEKAEGDVIWANGFNTSTNWVASAVSGTNATDFGWQYGATPNSVLSWAFSSSGTFTGGGGYFMCENGDPTGTPVQDPDAEWILEFDSIFNLAAYPNVLIQFQQYGALFTDKQVVEVSNDGGTTWAEVGNNDDMGALTEGGGSAYANPTNRSYNISQVVGPLSTTVKIRFRVYWPSGVPALNKGIMYGWYIDNVKLVEGYANDLKLREYYAMTGTEKIQYTKIPSSQLSSPTTTSFSAYVDNIGNASQNVTLNVAATAYTAATVAPLTIVGFDSDSITSDPAYTIPTTVGAIPFNLNVTSNNTLVNTGNDALTYNFEVTDYTLAVDGFTNAASINSSFIGWASGTGDPSIGNYIQIFQNAEVQSVKIGIANVSASQQTPYIGNQFFGTIYQYNSVTDAFDFYAQTTPVDLTAAHFGTIVTAYFDSYQNLTPGLYLVVAGFFKGAKVPIAMAGFVPQGQVAGFDGTTQYGLAGNESYYSQVEAPVVRLGFNDGLSVKESSFTSSVNVYPNPFVGTTEIEVGLKNAASVSAIVTDVAGRTVATIPAANLNAGNHTISINGNNFQAGIYNVTLTVGGETITKRIVKN